MPRVLVLNAGSSSLKWMVLDADSEAVEAEGSASWSGTEGGRHDAEIRAALQQVTQIDAIGHRVVHGGARYRTAVIVDDDVCRGIAQLAELAPLHNPAALVGITACREVFPGVPQVAAFDMAFHASLPEGTALYPLPWEWTQRWGLRRFGFHGLSVQYAVRRAAELLGQAPARLLVLHLGSGCSVTAVLNGRSVDTSMGFTPLEGLMMARRSGSVDPGLLLYLLGRGGLSVDELDQGLNERSGLLGVSGVSDDLRRVVAAADGGDARARLAIDLFVQRAATVASGMLASLGGLDAVAFTGGIGEHSALIRAGIAARLAFAGVALSAAGNAAAEGDADISLDATAAAEVRSLVITAREDLAILAEVRRLLPL